MQTQTTNYLRQAILICICLLLLSSLSTLGISFLPFEWVKIQLDALAVDGDAEKFTVDVFTTILNRLRMASIGLFAIGITSFLLRNTIRNWLQTWLQDISFYHLFYNLQNHIRNTWAETDSIHRHLLFIVFLSGVILRLMFLFQPMRHDEAFTFTNYASKPLLVALSNYSFPNNHLFHTFWVHLFYLCFGNHEWVIRMPAFIAGILALPTIYFVTRKLYTSNIALLTTALVVVSSPLIEYSTNARGYMFISLFFFFLLALLHYLLHTTDKTAWICFSVIGALGLYTIPTMVYPLALTTSWFLISLLTKSTHPNPKRQLQHLLIASIGLGLLTIILYTPVFLGSGPGALFSNRFVKSAPSWQSFVTGLQYSITELWHLWTWDYPSLLSQLMVISLVLGCMRYTRYANHHFPLPVAVLTCLILITFQRVTPPERAWLFLLPLFLTWIAIGFNQVLDLFAQINRLKPIQKALLPIASLTIMAVSIPGAIHNLSNYYQYGPGTLRDAEQMAKELGSQLNPTDRVLTVATAAPLEYYFKRNKVPIQYLRTPIAKANRIILIVMETKYSLDEVMGIARIPTDQFETHNKYVYDALKAHKAKTGLSLGINTSFNKHEEPIVCHPQDAVQELIRGGVDVLFVENYRVEKAS